MAKKTMRLALVLALVAVLRVNSAKQPSPLVTGCGRGGTHSTAAMLEKLGVQTAHEDFAANGVSVGWPYAAPLGDNEYIGYDWPPEGRYPFEKVKSYESRLKNLDVFAPVVLLVRYPLDVIASTMRCFCARGTRTTANEIKNDKRSWVFVEHNLNISRFLPQVTSHGTPLTWGDVPIGDIRRSMVYWYGWNTLVEEGRHDQLAGYSETVPAKLGAEHVVRLEDPDMLEKLTSLLNLSRAVQLKAAGMKLENAASGKSSDKDKEKFGSVSWMDLWHAAPKLAQDIWTMSKRYGYHQSDPPSLKAYLAESA